MFAGWSKKAFAFLALMSAPLLGFSQSSSASFAQCMNQLRLDEIDSALDAGLGWFLSGLAGAGTYWTGYFTCFRLL